MSLTLENARTILDAALDDARRRGLAPLAVAVLDGHGGARIQILQEKAAPSRPDIALGKARTAFSLGMPSKKVGKIAADRPAFYEALRDMVSHPLVPVAGGILVLSQKGAVLGAVGISGDQSELDEAAAKAGVRAAGFETHEDS